MTNKVKLLKELTNLNLNYTQVVQETEQLISENIYEVYDKDDCIDLEEEVSYQLVCLHPEINDDLSREIVESCLYNNDHKETVWCDGYIQRDSSDDEMYHDDHCIVVPINRLPSKEEQEKLSFMMFLQHQFLQDYKHRFC